MSSRQTAANEQIKRIAETIEEAKRMLNRPHLSPQACISIAEQLNQANNAAQRLVAIVLE